MPEHQPEDEKGLPAHGRGESESKVFSIAE
jgi:hypothetical protein